MSIEPLVLLAETVVPSTQGCWMEWDVTNHVKDAIYCGLSSVNFLIKDANTGTVGVVFNTKENGANPPEMIIDGVTKYSAGDTHLYSYIGHGTNGSATTMYVVEKNGDARRSIISFPITDLSSFSSSTLRLYYSAYVSGNPSGRTIQVYKLTRSNWVELQSTWNSYKTGSSWTTAGGDYTNAGEWEPPSGVKANISKCQLGFSLSL